MDNANTIDDQHDDEIPEAPDEEQVVAAESDEDLSGYVTPHGVQMYCPDCHARIGEPGSPAQVKEGALSKHRGSKRCLEFQEALADIRSRADAETLGGKAELKKPVRFVSPTKQLRVWLKPKITRPNPVDGRRDLIDPGLEIVFREGEFTTTDPEIVSLMRRSPSNVKVKERNREPVGLCKDRFYEAPATVGEVVAA